MKDRNLINKLQKIWDENQEKRKPPTADEVCEALSKELGQFVKYHKPAKQFYFKIDELGHYITETNLDNLYTINYNLPPRLIELIARFYRGLEE